ncbi:MAG: hypothetical protein WB615_13530 [Candidatus Tumulicola sp.]
MTRSRFSAAAVLLSVVLISGGCGFTNSPADGLTFKPPAGWQSSPGIMGFMQFWRGPNASDEVLVLIKSPKPLQTREVFNSANMRDAKIETEKPITICSNQPAEFFKAQGTSSRGGSDSNIEMVMTNAGGTTYMALYAYPVAAAPNAQASAALRELCTK